jgi:hypothetical protein
VVCELFLNIWLRQVTLRNFSTPPSNVPPRDRPNCPSLVTANLKDFTSLPTLLYRTSRRNEARSYRSIHFNVSAQQTFLSRKYRTHRSNILHVPLLDRNALVVLSCHSSHYHKLAKHPSMTQLYKRITLEFIYNPVFRCLLEGLKSATLEPQVGFKHVLCDLTHKTLEGHSGKYEIKLPLLIPCLT